MLQAVSRPKSIELNVFRAIARIERMTTAGAVWDAATALLDGVGVGVVVYMSSDPHRRDVRTLSTISGLRRVRGTPRRTRFWIYAPSATRLRRSATTGPMISMPRMPSAGGAFRRAFDPAWPSR